MTAKKETPLELVERHWAYVEGLLKDAGTDVGKLERNLYVNSFLHGYKHGKEDKK